MKRVCSLVGRIVLPTALAALSVGCGTAEPTDAERIATTTQAIAPAPPLPAFMGWQGVWQFAGTPGAPSTSFGGWVYQWAITHSSTGRIVASGFGMMPEAVAAQYGLSTTSAAVSSATTAATSTATATAGSVSLGSAVLYTGAIVGTVAVVVVLGVVAGDCYAHGECLGETVANAGGWGQVLGTAPSQTAQPIAGATTVSCHDPRPLADQCRASSIANMITDYYSWFGGSYWTCGELFNDPSSPTDAPTQLSTCNQLVNQCVTQTLATCGANGIPRGELQVQPANPNNLGE